MVDEMRPLDRLDIRRWKQSRPGAVPFDRIKSGKEEMAIVRFDQLHGVDMEGHVIFRMSFLFVGFVWIIVETVGWAASLFV